MRSFRLSARAFCLLVALFTGVAAAQAPGNAPETFGVSPVAHTIQAFGFQSFNSSIAANEQGTAFGSRYCNGGAGCFWEAPLFLPAGSVIDSVILDGCDTHASGDLQIQLRRIGAGESSNTQMAVLASFGSPGCSGTLVTATPAAHTIDNAAFSYWIEVNSGVTTGELRFQAVRVMYRLQVSPTPGTATFLDVPLGHPLLRFVEALVRSGVTAGCGGNNYCPNDPLTRGQMAVFLSVALGLHFTP